MEITINLGEYWWVVVIVCWYAIAAVGINKMIKIKDLTHQDLGSLVCARLLLWIVSPIVLPAYWLFGGFIE